MKVVSFNFASNAGSNNLCDDIITSKVLESRCDQVTSGFVDAQFWANVPLLDIISNVYGSLPKKW